MKFNAVLTLCLFSLSPTYAFFDFTAPGGFTDSIARDLRASWKGLNSPYARKHHLKRGVIAGKCSLRIVNPRNGTSVGGASPSQTPVSTTGTTTFHSSSSTSTAVASSSSSSTRSASLTRSPSASTGQVATTTSRSRSSPSSSTAPTPTYPPSIFSLKQVHNGSDFFDGWNFWSNADPTNGNVNYLDSTTAWSSGLVSINSAGNAVMRVDTTPVVSGNRNSIRIHSKESFNGGLLALDAVHMPYGCGTWPAFWTNGPSWPVNGEIDILEGVHASTENLVSLHTAPGCTVPADNGSSASSANVLDCSVANTANTGCGLRSSQSNSYGKPFNDVGGGVYAMLWDDSGIRVWYFQRGSIPPDLTRDAPLPNQWGTPAAAFPATNCNPYEFMQNHIAIFDTTLCGDWAGSQSSWTSSNYAGQGASCQAQTGVNTCTSYIQNNGGAFSDAYWEVKSVKLYQ